jgi:hypothetical protein
MVIKNKTQQDQKIKDVKIVIDMFNTIEKESNVTEERNI